MTRAQTNFHFRDGKISSRVIDLDNANHASKFLKHATEVIRCHGKVSITAADPALKLVNLETKMKTLRHKIAAWIMGGTVHTFEGRDGHGKWHLGKIIVTPEAMKAFRASFRTGASVYTDTALTDREPQNQGDEWTQEKADMVRSAKGGPPIGSQTSQANYP